MAAAQTYQSISRNPPGRLLLSQAGRERPAQDRTEAEDMNWLWLNVPLGSLIFIAVAGIPMWLVIKRGEPAAS
jgi:hypothetical protein